MRILIVDDDLPFRAALARLLERHGHYVLQAGAALPAIHMLTGARAEEIDAVLLDVTLGTPMGGLEVAGHAPEGVPVYIVTGHPIEAIRLDATSAQTLRIRGYFEKPIDEIELLATLTSVERAKIDAGEYWKSL